MVGLDVEGGEEWGGFGLGEAEEAFDAEDEVFELGGGVFIFHGDGGVGEEVVVIFANDKVGEVGLGFEGSEHVEAESAAEDGGGLGGGGLRVALVFGGVFDARGEEEGAGGWIDLETVGVVLGEGGVFGVEDVECLGDGGEGAGDDHEVGSDEGDVGGAFVEVDVGGVSETEHDAVVGRRVGFFFFRGGCGEG